MLDYVRIATTEQVWGAIIDAHGKRLKAFTSRSEPVGAFAGAPNKCRMMVEYGFDGAECPLIGYKFIGYNIDNMFSDTMENFWLCCPVGAK